MTEHRPITTGAERPSDVSPLAASNAPPPAAAGAVLSAADYAEFALPHSRRIFEIVGARVPTIHFGTGTAQMLDLMRNAGGDVIGADWRIPIDDAWDRIGHDRGIQGNLDPTTLLGPVARMCRQVDDIVERARGRHGHIFNLGHGILPSTPVEHVQMLASYVHRVTARPA